MMTDVTSETAPAHAPGMLERIGTTRAAIAALCAVLLVSGVAMVFAMQRTSTTFDEIVMAAAGARGYETGEWNLAPEHPPLVQYIYGLPVYLAGMRYPVETGITQETMDQMRYRYLYARAFYWLMGNDAERIALLSRLPAVACALGLVLLAFFWARRLAGNGAAVIAAALTAALPDLLAHGGVAYNDVPLALAFCAALWALDSAIRRPSWRRGALAGAAVALALGVKTSAIVLGPVALILLIWEAVLRRRDPRWRRDAARAAAACLAVAYIVLVAVYRGDLRLAEYRYAVGFVLGQVNGASPAFLLGETDIGGFWYFFPVAFLYKTSAGLHVLAGISALWFGVRLWRDPRRLAHTSYRAPLIGLLVFGGLLLTSSLNIGFRHALPVLPLVTLLTAAGIAGVWPAVTPRIRRVLGVIVLWPAVHVALHYPFFLSYISEYGPGEASAHEVLVDSSLDWGQGLLELRRFMAEHDIESVYLAYFGSALPAGYGIRHVPLVSYFPLPAQPRPERAPQWAAISATNLSGAYYTNDPFRRFREAVPAYVLARSIFLYPMPPGWTGP